MRVCLSHGGVCFTRANSYCAKVRALMMKFFARAREMAWHAVNGVVDGYYGVSLGYLRNLEVGL